MLADDRWQYAAEVESVKALGKLVCDVGGHSILLCNTHNGVKAVENLCTHLRKPLDNGRLVGGQVICPFHGACFDLQTGKALSGPAVFPLQTYPVHIDSGRIYVSVPETQTARACSF